MHHSVSFLLTVIAVGVSTPDKNVKSIDQRLTDFVIQFGGIPPAARKLEDYQARDHSSPWIQRLLGEGVACHYVMVYQLGEEWWTFCFDRREYLERGEEECWIIEAYSFDGTSWRETALYDAAHGEWQHPLPLLYGPASRPPQGLR